MTLARPWVLGLGAAFAVGVLLLHMLRRRPGPRVALPTARFLAPDRRTRLRLHAPAHPVLLALRLGVLAALTLAAGGAGVPPDRAGSVRIVALDAGAGMAPAWSAALDSAAAALTDATTRLVVFDTGAAVAAGAGAIDSLRRSGPSDVESDYRAALLGLRRAASASGSAAFEAALVTVPRAGAWGTGLAATRRAAWPAPIRVIRPAGDAGGARGTGAPARAAGGFPELLDSGSPDAAAAAHGARVRLAGAAAERSPHLRAALAASGIARHAAEADATLDDAAGEDAAEDDASAGRVTLVAGPDAPAGEVERTLAGGGFVASWGAAPHPLWVAGGDGAPGSQAAGTARGDGGPAATAVLGSADPRSAGTPWVLDAPTRILPGAPAPDAAVWAVADDGRPVGVAGPAGGGCAAHLALDLLDPRITASPVFPELVQALVGACPGPAGGGAVPANAAGGASTGGGGDDGYDDGYGAPANLGDDGDGAPANLGDGDGAPANLGDGGDGAPANLGDGALRVLSGASFAPATAETLGLAGERSLTRALLLLGLALAVAELGFGARAARRAGASVADRPSRGGERAA